MVSISSTMATLNGANLLPEQLDSIRIQTLTPKELIVTEDSSVGNTIEIVKKFFEAPLRYIIITPFLNKGSSVLQADRKLNAKQTLEGLRTDEKLSRLAQSSTAAGRLCDRPRKPA